MPLISKNTMKYGLCSLVTGSGNTGLVESKDREEFVGLLEMLRDQGWTVVSHTADEGERYYTALLIKHA